MPKISVVIATYNSEKTLAQTLDSIRWQTFRDFEVIVVDGLSSDNTVGIIEEYSDVVTRYVSEKDTGIYNAFNKGINLAQGDYVCFIGSDDCYCDYNVFEVVAKNIDSDTEMLSAPIYVVDNDTLKQHLYDNRLTREEVFSGNMIPHPGIFVKTEVMRHYGFNEDNRIISDYEFLVKFLLDDRKIKFIDYPVVYFSEGGTSSNRMGSESWCIHLAEHIVVANNLGLNRYIPVVMEHFLEFKKQDTFKYHFNKLLKILFRPLAVFCKFKGLLPNRRRHKCSLKVCRWCGRSLKM